MKITLESDVQVDGADVYVCGMDLARILRASFPNGLPDSRERVLLGRLRITVEHADDDS